MKNLLVNFMSLLLLSASCAFAINIDTLGSWGNENFSISSESVDRFKTLQNKYFCKESFKDTFKYCDSNDISNWKNLILRTEHWIVTINGKNICIVDWSEVTDIAQCNTTFTSLQSWKWYDCTVISGVEKCIDANTQISYDNNVSSSEWLEVNDEFTGNSNVVSNDHCTLNGHIVPCEQLQKKAFSFFKYIAWFGVIIFILGIAWTVFWILMLIDIIKYEEKDKTLWIFILVFLNVLWALVYYFTAKKHRKELN